MFDLWHVLKGRSEDIPQIMDIFQKYCANDSIVVSQSLFRENLELKKLNRDFRNDMNVLLSKEVDWNFDEAFDFVMTNIIDKMPR